MFRVKTILLKTALLFSFAGFSAADPAPARTAFEADISAPPAVQLLISLAPQAGSLENLPVPKAASAPPAPESEKVIQPGRELTPKVEDPIRVKAILKLVGDIYNNVHLPYPQDGSTFKNKEGKLPGQPLGFYKEYTLLTGDAPHTVVIGGQTWQVAPDLNARTKITKSP